MRTAIQDFTFFNCYASNLTAEEMCNLLWFQSMMVTSRHRHLEVIFSVRERLLVVLDTNVKVVQLDMVLSQLAADSINNNDNSFNGQPFFHHNLGRPEPEG